MEDVREEHTSIDELVEDLSDLDEILHNARIKVKKVMEKKDKFVILLQKVQEMEKEKDRIQALFEEGKIKHKLEKENMLDQLQKLKEERDKFANIVNLIKKPRILSEECDDFCIYDQDQILVHDPADDILENNNTSVSKSVTSGIEILTETELNSRILTECVQEFPSEYKAVSESSSSTECVLESCKDSVYGVVSPAYIQTLHESPTHTEAVCSLSYSLPATVSESPHTHSQPVLKSYAYLQAVLESPDDTETSSDICSHLQTEIESPSPIYSRASLNYPTRPQTILEAPKKPLLMLNESERENVESVRLVNNRIGDDVDITGSGIIAVTEDAAFMESVTDENLEETCDSENSSTVIVGDYKVTEDISQVEGGGGRTDSRTSYTKNRTEVSDVKRKVNIVIPEKENYSIETIVDIQLTKMKRKRLDVAEEVKDKKEKNSNKTVGDQFNKKIKSDVMVTFGGKKNETIVLPTFKEKKNEKSDDTVDVSGL